MRLKRGTKSIFNQVATVQFYLKQQLKKYLNFPLLLVIIFQNEKLQNNE
jgi:hypothetical protein